MSFSRRIQWSGRTTPLTMASCWNLEDILFGKEKRKTLNYDWQHLLTVLPVFYFMIFIYTDRSLYSITFHPICFWVKSFFLLLLQYSVCIWMKKKLHASTTFFETKNLDTVVSLTFHCQDYFSRYLKGFTSIADLFSHPHQKLYPVVGYR